MQFEESIRQEIALFESARPQAVAEIEVVWVISAFGTILRPLLPNHPIWGSWFDQRNLARGILLVLEVTSLRTGKRVQDISREDVYETGPTMVYNGEPTQNHDLRCVLGKDFPIPEDKRLSTQSKGKARSPDRLGIHEISFSASLTGY
jgi:hypothetical protein